jgi:hypothetical protein
MVVVMRVREGPRADLKETRRSPSADSPFGYQRNSPVLERHLFLQDPGTFTSGGYQRL